MLKLLGAILLITGTTGLGGSYCMEYRDRIHAIKNLKKILERILCQMDYARETLPELCKIISESCEEPYKEMLDQIYQNYIENMGRAFPEIWMEKCAKYLVKTRLNETEQELFCRLAEKIEFGEREYQKNRIQEVLMELQKKMDELEIARKSREKVIMSIGIMSGLLIVIVLI